MVFGLDDVLGIASLAAGAFGKKKAKASTSKKGFAALPEEVQQVFLETYLPGIKQQYAKQYQPPPMKRVNRPSSVFDSQGLYDLQQYSDAAGGLFTPLNKTPSKQPSIASNAGVDQEVMKKYGMNLADYIASRPDVVAALGGGNQKFTNLYGTGDNNSNAATGWWKDWGSRGY